jgi:hypothetical protein
MRKYIDIITEAGRAQSGGETGVNGFPYKGGQFLPSTTAPPGTWRVKIKGKSKLLHNKMWLVAPGQQEMAPTPFSRSIFSGIREYVNDEHGKLSINPTKEIAIEYVYGNNRDEFDKMIEMYNRGLRWYEVIPPGVEIVAKS